MTANVARLRAAALLVPQPEIEARVLAAVICEADKLEIATELEVGDFVDLRNREVFEALRELQAHGEGFCVTAVADRIESRDIELDRHVADKAGIEYLANLLINTPSYEQTFTCAAMSIFETDLRLLRKIANARKEAR